MSPPSARQAEPREVVLLKSRAASRREHRLRFRLGVVLLFVSIPLGWIGLAAGGIAAAVTGRHGWLLAGVVLYLSLWLPFLIGLALAGRSGNCVSGGRVNSIFVVIGSIF